MIDFDITKKQLTKEYSNHELLDVVLNDMGIPIIAKDTKGDKIDKILALIPEVSKVIGGEAVTPEEQEAIVKKVAGIMYPVAKKVKETPKEVVDPEIEEPEEEIEGLFGEVLLAPTIDLGDIPKPASNGFKPISSLVIGDVTIITSAANMPNDKAPTFALIHTLTVAHGQLSTSLMETKELRVFQRQDEDGKIIDGYVLKGKDAGGQGTRLKHRNIR